MRGMNAYSRVNVSAGLAGDGRAGVEARLIRYNELVLTGASDPRRHDHNMALRLIESGRIGAKRVVTRRFPLGETEKAIETSIGGEGTQVTVTP